MILAVCAAQHKNNDINFNISQIEKFIELSKNEKPDIVLFGESFLQGFNCLCFEYQKDIKTALSINELPIVRLRNLARKTKTAIGFGFIENAFGAIFSSYLIIGKDGEIIHCYKRLSSGWRIKNTCADYREGKQFTEFIFEGKRISVIICGDLWEDYLLDKLININCDIFLWPVFCDYKPDEWENSAKKEYSNRTAIFDKPILFINSLVKQNKEIKGGGAFIWHKAILVKQLPMGNTGYLVYKL